MESKQPARRAMTARTISFYILLHINFLVQQ